MIPKSGHRFRTRSCADKRQNPKSVTFCAERAAESIARGVIMAPEGASIADVPLDRLSRRNDQARTLRDGSGPLSRRAEPALARGQCLDQWRWIRARLVRRARPRTGPLSRGAPGLVGREPAPPVPTHPLAPVLRACARLDRYANDAPELPSLRIRQMAVHAQRTGRRLVADPPPRRSADSRRSV